MIEPESRYESRVGRINADMTTFWIFARMSWIATKLYNTALWSARETWDKTGKIPTGYDLQKVVLESYYHSFVPAHTYQHAAHQVGNAFRSWYALRKTDVTARPPGFRKKEELSTFMIDAFKVIDTDTILITPTDELKQELSYPHKKLTLKLHWNTQFPKNGKIKQIEIVPKNGYFELHAKILLPEPVWKTKGQIIVIDLGERNPIVSKDEQGNVDIFKGGRILSDLRYWNKEKSRVRSQVMIRTKGKKKNSRSLAKMATKGAAQVKHAIHAMTSTFVELCNQRNVKEVVVGDLTGIKKEKDGKGKKWNDKANQNWQQFPIRTLVTQLDYKLARYGIKIVEQDEKGTSKGRCSICGCTDRKKLHRVHRGLFLCENCGTVQNADVNGAGNQLARYLRMDTTTIHSSSGCLAQPSIWNWDNHRWTVVR
jgi:putative transposase